LDLDEVAAVAANLVAAIVPAPGRGRENLASAEATIPVLGSGKTNHVALAKTLIDSGA
jgi:hypothetical protein